MESEWLTRRARIDPRLAAAGWTIRPAADAAGRPLGHFPRTALTEYQTATGPCDYALIDRGRVVGVVEAKKVSVAPRSVLGQSERYDDGLDRTAPFLYSTNGEQIYFEDRRTPAYRSRAVAAFHTPDALRERLDRNDEQAAAWFAEHPNNHPLRPYQKDAISAVEQAVAAGKRQMLVAMATGTGKTFTTVSLIYWLIRSGMARRVLFLVDRRALAAQATQAFASFEAEPNRKFTALYDLYSQRFRREELDDTDKAAKFDPTVLPQSYLTRPDASKTFVCVSTIQRMAINLFGRAHAFALNGDADGEDDDDDDRIDIPIHAFDVIIADECHRGYTAAEESVWRDVLNHFDAIRIGLTATPAPHTTAYFNEVVYRYEYERAVREGYLVDYDAVKMSSGVLMNGVFLKEGEHVGRVDPETGAERLDRLEVESSFDASEIERKVTAPDTNRKVIREFAAYAREHEAHTGRFPKTLIFAANDQGHTSHADQLVEICREEFGRGDAFVQKITGNANVDRPLQRIREFRNRPQPGIVVTVDMLSTGVDIPVLENIIFLRPVKSRILFEQMLGRGTRLCPDIHKSHFTVFDCFDGTLLQFFRDASTMAPEAPEKPTRTLREIVADIWQNRDRDYNVRALVRRLRRIEREMSGEARELFAGWLPDGDIGAFAEALPRRIRSDFTATMQILRDEGFLDLCVSYPRPPRVFYRAYGVRDEVSSELLFRTTDGRELKPYDYLIEFERFVREHADDIDAIAVLLGRPHDWNTARLRELRLELTRAAGQFTIERLRRAYREELADIISLVKHAARSEEPILSGAERAARAVTQVSAGRTLTAEQRRWLERIERHLAENLTVERDDFEAVPVFADVGGWRRADRDFGGALAEILRLCNEAIAA